ncbi:hypothetical protein LTR36_004967 [Oleoguttula mirabilis]|uniref:Uncharacterized protein n=1 Tax=Oleoguttula mirabilis TaxID=1507867 RepID=A0AAV9JVN4_9PEZI|nr:hypothetical protein LTR36_004967 [Oleoguttula mirabilis]
MSTTAKDGATGSADAVQDTKQNIFSLGVHPELDVATLYRPVMVTVMVDSPPQEYQAPKGQRSSISLPDVPHWVFEVYIGWLYTQRLVLAPTLESGHASASLRQGSVSVIEDQSVFDDTFTTPRDGNGNPAMDVQCSAPDKKDASTWPWQQLVELYIFGDQYDTRTFRTSVIEAIQVKAFQTQPHKYSAPDLHSMKLVFTGLPPESPLYRLFFELLTWDRRPMQDAAAYATLPAEVLAASWLRLQQIRDHDNCGVCTDIPKHCRIKECTACAKLVNCGDPCHGSLTAPMYDTDVHEYHEHESKEETELCERRWRVIVQDRWPRKEGDSDDHSSEAPGG